MKAETLRLGAGASARPAACAPCPAPAAKPAESPAPHSSAAAHAQSDLILRFQKSERLLHWSIAIPFMVCYVSAAVLMFFFNLHDEGIWRGIFSGIHRCSAACLMVLPGLVLLRYRKEAKIHLYNIRQGWVWAVSDVKWLFLMGPAAVSRRITLPDQGKFNAAEKLNFMMVMATYPLFIATGLVLWMPGIAFFSWIIHVGLAGIATPLMCGHIFMALVNPGTRVGLSGMISGYVDRHWAKHHYTRWYREHFEEAERKPGGQDGAGEEMPRPILVRCAACGAEHWAPSWQRVLEAIFELRPLTCPACGLDARIAAVIVGPGEGEGIRPSLQLAGLGNLVVDKPKDGNAGDRHSRDTGQIPPKRSGIPGPGEGALRS